MRAIARSPLWPWVKALVVLVALDWLLFGAGIFFALVPGIQRFPVTWGLVYRCVKALQAPSSKPMAYAVGSSIVFLGLDELHVQKALDDRGIESGFTSLTVFGASGVDQALLAHAAERNRPWLVVLTGSVRDFPAKGTLDSPVSRVLYDSSIDFAPLAGDDVERRLAAAVRRVWGLYRYRYFVRAALLDGAGALVGRIAPDVAPVPPATGPLWRPETSESPVPPEAFEWFFRGRITADSWAAWTHWRETRRFADYQDFLKRNRSAAIDQYGRQTFETHGPDGNPQFEAFAWIERELAARGVRVVVLAFPENPVLQDPEAKALYDDALSDAVARRLETDARAGGARFVDLRRFLAPEDFYDLIHPNLSGSRKLSTRFAEIVGEEWQAAGR